MPKCIPNIQTHHLYGNRIRQFTVRVRPFRYLMLEREYSSTKAYPDESTQKIAPDDTYKA